MGDILEELIVKGLVAKQVGQYIQEKKPLDAINFIWPQLLKDRDNPELNMLLGVSYFHHGDDQNAKLYLSIALKKDPNDYHARYFLAGVFARQKQFLNAEMNLQDLLDRGYEHPDVYARLSEIRKILDT